MAWNRALARPIALLIVLCLIAEPGLRVLHAAEDRKTDITALGVLPLPGGGSLPAAPASHLPVGFEDIGSFHEGLVTDSEGTSASSTRTSRFPAGAPHSRSAASTTAS